jgi:helix-turn-helix protein
MRAGLSVASVSQRTRIRESLIRAIEADDYSGCGGDFYARGHIRSIASAVGTDPEPLVWEYDKNYRAPQEITAADAFEPVRPIQAREREQRQRARREQAPRGPVQRGPVQRGPVQREPYQPRRRRRTPWPMLLLVALVVVIGLVGYLLVAGSSPASHTPQAASSHPASHHPGSPAPTPSQHSTPPSPPPAATTLNPAGVTTFGPNGGDNSQLARHAIEGNPGSWHTDWYTTADFGGLQHGTGLLLNMGKQVTITSARIRLGSAAGTSLQLRAGNSPSLGGLKQVAHATNANGVVNLHLPSPAHGRYLLIWITRLPPDSSGTYQASVAGVHVSGRT